MIKWKKRKYGEILSAAISSYLVQSRGVVRAGSDPDPHQLPAGDPAGDPVAHRCWDTVCGKKTPLSWAPHRWRGERRCPGASGAGGWRGAQPSWGVTWRRVLHLLHRHTSTPWRPWRACPAAWRCWPRQSVTAPGSRGRLRRGGPRMISVPVCPAGSTVRARDLCRHSSARCCLVLALAHRCRPCQVLQWC